MFPVRDIGHTVLGDDILVSTKLIDPYSALPEEFHARLGLTDVELVLMGLKSIETMILTKHLYRFSNYRLRYQIHDEICAVRRHQWIVWVICELTGYPHPIRRSRWDFVGSDSAFES